MRKSRVVYAVVGLFALVATAEAKDYVLTAKGTLGKGQVAAVQAAGGTVYYSHAGTGLVMARSDSAAFAQKVMASGAFTQALEDRIVQWTPAVKTVDLQEATSNPGNDTYYPIQWAPASNRRTGRLGCGLYGQGHSRGGH